MHNFIEEILIDLHMVPCAKGYKYLVFAIEYKVKNSSCSTMDLYKIIADHYGTNYACVERDMRWCIHKGWDYCSSYLIDKYLFGYYNYLDEYIKNSVLIELIALYVKHYFFLISYFYFYIFYTLED